MELGDEVRGDHRCREVWATAAGFTHDYRKFSRIIEGAHLSSGAHRRTMR
jgi:hypothetical protein